MSAGPVVRMATPADAVVLADLNRNEQDENHRRVPEWFAAPGDPDVADLMRGWLCRDGAVGFVAEIDDRLAGYALAAVHHRRATRSNPESHWIDLDQIAVAPSARRQGVARALCEAVIAHAADLHLDAVQLNVWAFNPEANALFEALGFEQGSLRLNLDTAGKGRSDHRSA
jgi:ribosomal protein S18 acetylase RimI-like enzyme